MKNFTVNAKSPTAKLARVILLIIFFSLSTGIALIAMHTIAGFFGIDMSQPVREIGLLGGAILFFSVFILGPILLFSSMFILDKLYKLLNI